MSSYSSVANTTFSYILTLDEFRKKFPKEHKPSWVKITTITMISKFVNPIDIHTLRDRLTKLGPLKINAKGSSKPFEWELKTTKFYNQITLGYTDEYSTKSIKLFPNGSIQVAGCSDLFDCNRVIKQIIFLKPFLILKKKSQPTVSELL